MRDSMRDMWTGGDVGRGCTATLEHLKMTRF